MGYAAAEAATPPVLVVTRNPPEKTRLGDRITFIIDGIGSAVSKGCAMAEERDVVIMGGAATIRGALEAGLLDELKLHLSPVILGSGTPLFTGGTPAFAAPGAGQGLRARHPLDLPGRLTRRARRTPDHRSRRRPPGRLSRPHRPRTAHQVGTAERSLHRRGELVLRRALRAGYRPGRYLVDAKRVDQIADLRPTRRSTPPRWTCSNASPASTCTAVCSRRSTGCRCVTADDVISTARRLAILEDVNNHTNIGAVFRGAAALGIDAVLLSPTCADPLYRRSVRVSMGEVFAVPYARLEPWPDGLDRVRAAGFTVLALTPGTRRAADATPEAAPSANGPALLLGAEGPGPVPARAGGQRRAGEDPDAPRRRLAERRRGRRRGVLGTRAGRR